MLTKPSKHAILNQCWVDVGPSSTTLAQHQPNTGTTSRVYWEGDAISQGSVSDIIISSINLSELSDPANTRYRHNVGPMLALRLRRRPNIGQSLDVCVVFAWYIVFSSNPANTRRSSNAASTLILFVKTMETKGFFHFKIIMNVLVIRSLRFI